MSDKPIAGLVAAALVAPLCAVCILGPAALGLALGWFAGEIGGFGAWTTASAVVAGAAGVYGVVRWRRRPKRKIRTSLARDPEKWERFSEKIMRKTIS